MFNAYPNRFNDPLFVMIINTLPILYSKWTKGSIFWQFRQKMNKYKSSHLIGWSYSLKWTMILLPDGKHQTCLATIVPSTIPNLGGALSVISAQSKKQLTINTQFVSNMHIMIIQVCIPSTWTISSGSASIFSFQWTLPPGFHTCFLLQGSFISISFEGSLWDLHFPYMSLQHHPCSLNAHLGLWDHVSW